MGVDHLGEVGLKQEIQRLWSAVRKVSRATLQNGSIGRAGIRVYDGGWIRIEDGGLQVTGTASVSGRLEGSGTFDWTGPMNLAGNQTVTGNVTYTGQMTVNGPWKMVGAGQITGNVDITGVLTLLGGGSIKAGNIEITPSLNGGTIKVGAHTIYVSGAVLALNHSSGGQVILNNGSVSLIKGGNNFTVSDSGFSASLPTIARTSANNATVGTVYMNTSGQMFRVVS